MYFDEVISNEWNISTALDLYSVEYPDAVSMLRAIKFDLTRITKNPNMLKSAREKSELLLDRWNVSNLVLEALVPSTLTFYIGCEKEAET